MSNLLDKASIILTPTAYNNGKALCVKPSDGSGDFDFSRNSAATRVNAQGLVENVQILSSNLVQNGDFSEEGAEEVSNGSFTNGSTDWTLGTGWSIGEDKVVADNVSSNTIQNLSSIDANKSYNISFNISDYLGGQFFITFGGNDNTINFTANGSYSVYINPTNTVNNIFYLRGNGFTGSITNISVKEVGMDWETNDANITIQGGYASFNSPNTYTRLTNTPTTNIIQGKTYKAKCTVSNYVSGICYFRMPFNNASGSNRITSNGEYEFISVADNNYSNIVIAAASSNAVMDITNISVIEITDDTNLPRINYEGFSFDGSGNIIPDSGCGSWLWEPQTTQLLPYSEDFSNASWGKGTDVSIEGGYLAPDGNNTAYKVTKTGISTPYLTRNQSLVATTTRSIYAKTVSGTGTATLLSHNSNTNNTFTLTEQWQRFELSDTASSSGQSTFYAADFRGSGTLTEYLVWGANATNDQDYATSYIPSNGSQVTRNQDLCINGGSLATINSTEGTLYFEGSVLANTSTFEVISLSDGGTSNILAFVYRNVLNQFSAVVKSGGSTSLSKTITLADATDTIKVAVSYKLNDFRFYLNGVLIIADTSGNTPIGLNTLHFADGNGTSNKFFGKTKALAVFPYLSDQELTELTTI